MRLEVQNAEEVKKKLKRLRNSGMKKVLRRTVDRVATQGKRQVVDVISKGTNIKSGAVRSKVATQRSTINRLNSVIYISNFPFSILDAAKYKVNTRTGEVSIDTSLSRGSELEKTFFWPGAKKKYRTSKKKRKSRGSGKKWSKKQIFERTGKSDRGQDRWIGQLSENEQQVSKSPIRYAQLPGACTILKPVLRRELNNLVEFAGNTILEQVRLELERSFGNRN